MSVCAKFQLSSWSRSVWKVCGSGVGGVGNAWLLCLTPTLVALELFWVGLSYVGFWQHIFRHISYASPGSFYHFLPINLVGRFRTRYGVLGSFMRFYDPEKRLQTKRPQAKRPTAKSSLYKIKALNIIFFKIFWLWTFNIKVHPFYLNSFFFWYQNEWPQIILRLQPKFWS